MDVPVTLDTVASLKKRVLSVNETYDNVEFIGMVTLEDTIYLRSKISGHYEDISSEQTNLLAAYYEKND